MNYLLFIGSIILGILFKSYDEIVDNNLKINKEYIIILQISMIFLSVYLYYKDTLFMIICIMAYYCAYIYDIILLNNKVINTTQLAMNNSFWHFYAILLIPMIIYNYTKIIQIKINNIKIYTFLIYITIGFFLCLFEAYLFPEENSSAKILTRIIYLVLYIILLLITSYFKIYFYRCIPLLLSFWLGYFATSVIFKQYIIPDSNINISGTFTYIWKKLKSKKLQQKLNGKNGNNDKKGKNGKKTNNEHNNKSILILI
jgi:hypothetical protein